MTPGTVTRDYLNYCRLDSYTPNSTLQQDTHVRSRGAIDLESDHLDLLYLLARSNPAQIRRMSALESGQA